MLSKLLTKIIPGERGQSYTLESVTGSIILMTTILFMVMSTMATPLATSTSNQFIEEQNRILAEDVLDSAEQQNLLSEFVRYYDTDNSEFVGASGEDGYYTSASPPTEFGSLLYSAFTTEFTAFNVEVSYQTDSGVVETQQVVYQGRPSENAAVATTTVFLYDDMVITDPDNSKTLSEDNNFYVPDVSSGAVYNTVEIKLTVWSI